MWHDLDEVSKFGVRNNNLIVEESLFCPCFESEVIKTSTLQNHNLEGTVYEGAKHTGLPTVLRAFADI